MKIKTYYKYFLSVILLVPTIIFANAKDEIIVPLQFSEQGFPVATVQIQNHNIPLIFDNGASRSNIVLNKDIVKQLNLKIIPTNNEVCSHDDTGKRNCLKTYIIPELKIGQLTLQNISCELMDKLWGGHYDEGFKWFAAARNGVIGLKLLQQFNLLLDYKHSRAILTTLGTYPKEYDIKNWVAIPFDKKGIINAQINGVNVSLVTDTGANNSIMKASAKVLVDKKPCDPKKDLCQYLEPKTFTVGNKQLPKIKFGVQQDEFPFDGVIGSSFFKEHQAFFDYQNNILFINNQNDFGY